MNRGPSESVKHVKVVGQAHAKQLEQFQLEFVATVGRGKWVDQARVDDGHGEYLTYAVNLLDKLSVSGSSAGSQINVDLTPIELTSIDFDLWGLRIWRPW